MSPKYQQSRGRIVLAVAISLAFHGLFGIGWLALRPAGGGGSQAFPPTEVDGPDDHEFVINLREPPVVVRPQPKREATEPKTLPSEIVRKPANDPGTTRAGHSDTDSPRTLPDLPKNDPGMPLHGKLKAGKTIVYAIDRSSSMGSDGLLRAACQAIKDSLAQLSPESRFQIVAYNSGFSTLASEPLSATEANVAQARQWLAELTAEGASDHRGGLREAISFHPDAVFLLTDADDLDERDVRSIRTLLREPVYLSVAIFGNNRPKAESPLERLMNEVGGKVKYVGR
jgi:von Willebrand factor type A domain